MHIDTLHLGHQKKPTKSAQIRLVLRQAIKASTRWTQILPRVTWTVGFGKMMGWLIRVQTYSCSIDLGRWNNAKRKETPRRLGENGWHEAIGVSMVSFKRTEIWMSGDVGGRNWSNPNVGWPNWLKVMQPLQSPVKRRSPAKPRSRRRKLWKRKRPHRPQQNQTKRTLRWREMWRTQSAKFNQNLNHFRTCEIHIYFVHRSNRGIAVVQVGGKIITCFIVWQKFCSPSLWAIATQKRRRT